MNTNKNLRIAWLIPITAYYWQHSLSELTKIFPKTRIFTARWSGFAKGFENSVDYEVVGQAKALGIKPKDLGYDTVFTAVSPNIIGRLLQFKPNVIFCVTFGLWTILALLFKPIGRWRVVIAYDGSSPGVDFRNSPMRLALRRAMVKAVDACVTNNQAGKAYLVEILKSNQNRVFVEPYQIPTPKSLFDGDIVPEPNLPKPGQFTFIFVGQIIPRKGLKLLLQACILLREKGLQNFRLLILGKGFEQEELVAFCQENNLENCVQWLGKVDYSQLGEYFRSADVFILPTLEDTWGMVVLEAMLMGKPILCSKYAGAAELVVEGKNGYCFDPNDIKIMAGLMEDFIVNPDLVVSMGKVSQQIIAQYTPEKAGKGLADITHFVMEN
jgi:glycosyltransferase involved in cell wall biosynthesis